MCQILSGIFVSEIWRCMLFTDIQQGLKEYHLRLLINQVEHDNYYELSSMWRYMKTVNNSKDRRNLLKIFFKKKIGSEPVKIRVNSRWCASLSRSSHAYDQDLNHLLKSGYLKIIRKSEGTRCRKSYLVLRE